MKNLNFHHLMRSLHRDIGYLIIGSVIIFSLSGIALVYRNTDFLKHEVTIERNLKPNLTNEELAGELHMRDFKEIREEGNVVNFENGTYDRASGTAVFESSEVIFPFNRFIDLHKSNSSNAVHWFTLAIGILLLFMAVSSFWMMKAGTKLFKRALIFTFIGVSIAVIVLFV